MTTDSSLSQIIHSLKFFDLLDTSLEGHDVVPITLHGGKSKIVSLIQIQIVNCTPKEMSLWSSADTSS